MIQDPDYAKAIFAFFNAIIVDVLPLRLTDVDFVNMVTDEILNNDKSLFTAISKQY